MASLSGLHHACMAASVTRLVSVRRAQAVLLYGVRGVFVSGAVCVCLCVCVVCVHIVSLNNGLILELTKAYLRLRSVLDDQQSC
jgi:hypothetical protein